MADQPPPPPPPDENGDRAVEPEKIPKVALIGGGILVLLIVLYFIAK